MIRHTTDAELVNDILRDAFGNPAIDVSGRLANGAHALVSEDSDGVVLFTPSRKEAGVYRCTMGIRTAAQASGLGTLILREALSWAFENTDATVVKGRIDPLVDAIVSITDKLKDGERSLGDGERLHVSCTREHFAKLTGGGHG